MSKNILLIFLLVFLSIPCSAKSPQKVVQDKVIVIYNSDKSVSVIYPAPKSQRPQEKYQDFLNRIYQRSVSSDASLSGLSHEIISSSALPSREFRDAWEGAPGRGVYVNKTKAKKQEKENIKKQLIAEEKEKFLEEQAIERLKKQGKWE